MKEAEAGQGKRFFLLTAWSPRSGKVPGGQVDVPSLAMERIWEGPRWTLHGEEKKPHYSPQRQELLTVRNEGRYVGCVTDRRNVQ